MMKLSEAMHLGAMLKPQAFGNLRSADGSATCALMAAVEGAGLQMRPARKGEYAQEGRAGRIVPEGESVCDIPLEWRSLLGESQHCPMCKIQDRVFETIAHLNDYHCWTREQIAVWVEQLENGLDYGQALAAPEAEKVGV